jgi:CubicO group peptidase (beta-lactamase class C family)
LNLLIKEGISEYLRRITPFGFTGTVLVGSGDEIIHSGGYGLANRNKQIENTPETYHDIGSLTKQFTAAGILRLEMEGKLTTEDSLDLFFEDLPPDKKTITLHHLLTHTSGIHDGEWDDYDVITKEQALARIFDTPTNERENFLYSNDGYTLLAAIIEKVTGQGYEEYLFHHLFKPAKMANTGYTIPRFIENQIANGYVNELDCGNPLEKNYPYWNLMGNGGMLSTADDLFKWHCALQGEQILSNTAKKKLLTPYLRDYAYGWKVHHSPEGMVMEHGGASSYGTCAFFRRFIDRNIVIIVLCNQFRDGGNQLASLVANKLGKLIFGQDVNIPPSLTSTNKSEKVAHPFVEGNSYRYQLPTEGIFELCSKGTRLVLTTEAQDCLDLFFGMDEHQECNKKITNLSREIWEEIMVGKYHLLESYIENPQVVTERKTKINSFLSSSNVTQGMEHIGTIPSTIFPGTFEVRYRLNFEGGSQTNLLFFWKNDRIHYLGFIGQIAPTKIECIKNKETYIGHSIEHETTITLQINPKKITI